MLQSIIHNLSTSENIPREIRTFHSKIRKAFETLHFEKARNQQQISALTRQLEEYKARKKRKVLFNANETFADIKRIKEVHDKELATGAAWTARDRAKEAKETAEMMLRTTIEGFLGEFYVMEP